MWKNKVWICFSLVIFLYIFSLEPQVANALKESGAERLQGFHFLFLFSLHFSFHDVALKNFEKWFFEQVEKSFSKKEQNEKEENQEPPKIKRKIKLGIVPGSTEAGIFATEDINVCQKRSCFASSY